MKISLVHPRLIYLPSQQPLGLGYIAACLEKQNHDVQFIEGAFYPSDEDIVEEIGNFGSKVVGISVMVSYHSKALNLAKKIKLAYPDIVIVMGGAHPSVVPFGFISHDFVDYVIAGEGEESFVLLVEALERNASLNDILSIPGIFCRKGISAVRRTPRIEDIDALPWPARHLMPMDKYMHRDNTVSFGMHGGNFNIMTTRGCPFRCNFCDHSVFGHKPITRKVQNVVDEIEYTSKKYNIRNFDVMDDTFTMSRRYVMQFCEELISRKLDLFWCCRLRVNAVTKEMLQKMAEAGCVRFSVGIESVDDRVLKAVNKQITIEKVIQVLKWAKEYGILTIGNFMIGNLGDDRESIYKTLQFALEVDEVDLPSFVVLVPLPGTEIARIGKENGWIRSYEWDDYRMNIKDLPMMRNEALSHQDIQEIYADVANAVRSKIAYAIEHLHKPRIRFYPELVGGEKELIKSY